MSLDPRQNRAPIDLRLLPAATGCWLGNWWLVARPPAIGIVACGALLLMALIGSFWLGRPAPGRHRRARRDRLTATVVLSAVVVAAVLGLTTVRVTERQAAVADLPREVTALVRPTAEALPLAAQQSERYRVPAQLLAVDHDADRARDVPVLLLTDATWRDAPVGTTWTVHARVAPTAPGDDVAVLLIADGEGHQHNPAAWHDRAVSALRTGLVGATGSLAPQARGLVPGISIGDTRALPAPLAQDMRTVSLTHITAVSGMHVAIVLGAVLLVLWWAPLWVRAVAGALVLAGFVALVYPSGSVVRAGTMGALLLLGLATGRPRSSIPALLATVVVLLGFDPWLARDFGFTLSVVATGGLLALAPVFAGYLRTVCPEPVAMSAGVSAAAQLVCTPVILLLAPGLPVHGVLANVLAMPAVPGATLLGVAATVTSPFWPGLAATLATAAGWFTAWIATVATFTADLPLATLPWPEGSAGAVLVGLALIAGLAWWRARR